MSDLASNVAWKDFDLLPELQQKLGEAIPSITKSVTNILSEGLNSVFKTGFKAFGVVGSSALAFFLGVYILLEKESFFSMTRRVSVLVLKEKRTAQLSGLLNLLHRNIGKYIVARALDSSILGFVSAIALACLGVPYSGLLGLVIAILNMIPIIGPFLGIAIVVVFCLLTSFSLALWTLIVLVVIQQVEMLLLEPKLVGTQLGLNPFLTLLAVTVGGHFFGAIGMILGVPIVGVLKQLSVEKLTELEQEAAPKPAPKKPVQTPSKA